VFIGVKMALVLVLFGDLQTIIHPATQRAVSSCGRLASSSSRSLCLCLMGEEDRFRAGRIGGPASQQFQTDFASDFWTSFASAFHHAPFLMKHRLEADPASSPFSVCPAPDGDTKIVV
jgi:hypothetical protein